MNKIIALLYVHTIGLYTHFENYKRKNMHFRFQFRSGQDQIMEMTNDWYQLYAQGTITHNTNGMIHVHYSFIYFFHLFIYFCFW